MGALFATAESGEPPVLNRVLSRLSILNVVCGRGYNELGARDGVAITTDERGLVPLPDWIYRAEAELEQWEIECLNTPLGTLPQWLVGQATWQCEGIVVLLWAVRLGDRPSFDRPVTPLALFNEIERVDWDSAGLRDPDELRDYAENVYSWWRRLRWFSVEQENVDFVAHARACGLEIGQLPLVANDVAIRGRSLVEATDEVFGDDFLAVAGERLRAAKWLSGRWGGIYSEVEVSMDGGGVSLIVEPPGATVRQTPQSQPDASNAP